MVCGFARITKIILVYRFDRVSSFFFIELEFVIVYFLPIQLKKIVLKKNHVIKLYKIYSLAHRFGWLTWWFVGMVNLTSFFLFLISSIDIRLIENSFS